MKKKITIRDVARECGYSIFTVSSVLNNRGNITPETSGKVAAAAKKLNYNVLKNVSAVQRMRTRSIGIVLPDSGCMYNTFYNRALSTFREAASIPDYDCKLFTEEDIAKRFDDNNADSAHSLGCKGLIFFCPRSNYRRMIDELLKQSVAVALIRRQHTERKGLLQLVDSDFEGATQMLNYLHHDAGCQRLVYSFGQPLSHRNRGGRDFAFDDYIEKNSSVTANLIIEGAIKPDAAARSQLIQFIRAGREQNEKTAVFCWTDTEAVSIIGALNQAGFRLPDDVCVSGYNNDPQSQMTFPAVTTMNIPVEEMVQDACRYLFDYIDDGDMPRSRVIKFTHDLIKRESTENAPQPTPANNGAAH